MVIHSAYLVLNIATPISDAKRSFLGIRAFVNNPFAGEPSCCHQGYKRLAKIKKRADPANLFRVNQNTKPKQKRIQDSYRYEIGAGTRRGLPL